MIALDNVNLGGESDSKYSGSKGSWNRLIGVDLHSTAGLVKVRQKLTKASGAIVESLCKVSVDCSDGNKYWFSSTSGKVFKDASNVWTLTHTTTPNAGGASCLGAWEYNGFVYWATEKRLHRIRVSGTSDWATNAEEDWAELNLDQTAIGGTGQTYSLTTSVSETATHRQTFTPVNSPIEAIGINVGAKGTSTDWTIKIHDSANTEVASGTLANASVTASAFNIFSLASTWYPTLGSSYHVHVYGSSTTGTPTVVSSVASDLEGGNIKLYTTSDSEYHPMQTQNLILYIGDKHFIHQVEEQSDGSHLFSREALDIQKPDRVKTLGKMGVDLIIGTIVNATIAKAKVYWWNTWSVSFSEFDEVDEVGINAFIIGDNTIFVQAGISGNMYYITSAHTLEIYRKIKGDYSPTKYGTVHPNAWGNLGGLIVFGFSNGLGNPADQGVYVLGRHTRNYPFVVDLSFPISERVSSALVTSGVEIGSILVSGLDMWASYKRSSTVTMTIATPAVVTYTGHGLSDGTPISFTTTGALPTGVTAGTVYYAKSTGTNTLNLYDTSAHAISGGATGRVDTSGSQSGTHTATNCGVDKLDYSNKLELASMETRLLVPFRGVQQNFHDFVIAYENLPASTGYTLNYDRNHTGSYTAFVAVTELVPDTDRKIYRAEMQIDANVLQLKVGFTVATNDAPTFESMSVLVD